MSWYRYCIVPECRITTVSAPGKHFFSLPSPSERRKQWILAMRRDPKKNKPISDKSCLSVCEEHFDFENDIENFIRYKMQGVRPILKKHVVPHKFECQQKVVKTRILSTLRAQKRKHREIVDELLKSSGEVAAVDAVPDIPNLNADLDVQDALLYLEESKPSNRGSDNDIVTKETSDCFDSSFLEPKIVIKEEPIDNCEDPTSSRLDHEFILPCTDSYQSCSTPAIKEAFPVVKTEPIEEPQQITSNCRMTKPNKRQTSGTVDVAKQINTNGRTTKPSSRKTVEKNNVVELTENRPTEEDAATSKTSSSKDSFDVYGEFIAAKLRNLDLNSCLYVQKAFADILFDAEIGKFK